MLTRGNIADQKKDVEWAVRRAEFMTPAARQRILVIVRDAELAADYWIGVIEVQE